MTTVSETTDPTELVELAAQLRWVGLRFPGFAFQLNTMALELESEIEEKILWDQCLESHGLDREKVKHLSEDERARFNKAYDALLDRWDIVVPEG